MSVSFRVLHVMSLTLPLSQVESIVQQLTEKGLLKFDAVQI